MVRAVALRSGFGRSAECNRFWDSANIMAQISLMLAERLKLVEKEELYTIGLFHDCGMLLMMQHFPDYKTLLSQANNTPDRPVTAWEDERYGLNHTDLGFLISVSWYLPPTLCHVVASHHRPFADLAQSQRRISDSALTLLAAHKASHHIHTRHRQMVRGDMVDMEWDRDNAAVLGHLGISEPDFFTLRDDLLDSLDDTAA